MSVLLCFLYPCQGCGARVGVACSDDCPEALTHHIESVEHELADSYLGAA